MDTSDFRNGLSIIVDNDIYTIVEFQHVKPGKGGAFVRSKLKDLINERMEAANNGFAKEYATGGNENDE